ncbi:MAG: GNAT family N-acetyltransferase [Rickettsiaceae bacterium]|nr:GNAT family N-acetyltransferase [Rickettsiaceae bacterium]
MIKFLLNILRPFKLLIFGQVTVAIFWAVDLSLRPYLLKLMVDRLPNVQAADINQQLLPLIVFYLIMSLLLVIMFRFYDFIWLQLNPRLKRHVGDILVKMMMDHSITLFQNQFAGNLANKVKDVMSGIPDLVKLFIQQFFSNFLAVCIAVFAVWTISSTFSLLLLVWVAHFKGEFAGYVTLKWQSQYPSFKAQNIPEIMDLNVLPAFRKMGIVSLLLDAAEKEALTKSEIIGIGVGLYAGPDGGYGAAQRLYIKRGYIPDGKGVTYNYEPTIPCNSYLLDDELVLWFTKKLS